MVVLPDPDGPMIDTFSPAPTSKFSERSTWLSPQLLLTPSKEIITSLGRSGSRVGTWRGLLSA